MKCETLNGILTFVLGVLVVLGVVLAIRMISLTHEQRVLERQFLFANTRLTQTQGLLNDTLLYNKSYPSPDLQRVLQTIQGKTATR